MFIRAARRRSNSQPGRLRYEVLGEGSRPGHGLAFKDRKHQICFHSGFFRSGSFHSGDLRLPTGFSHSLSRQFGAELPVARGVLAENDESAPRGGKQADVTFIANQCICTVGYAAVGCAGDTPVHRQADRPINSSRPQTCCTQANAAHESFFSTSFPALPAVQIAISCFHFPCGRTCFTQATGGNGGPNLPAFPPPLAAQLLQRYSPIFLHHAGGGRASSPAH